MVTHRAGPTSRIFYSRGDVFDKQAKNIFAEFLNNNFVFTKPKQLYKFIHNTDELTATNFKLI